MKCDNCFKRDGRLVMKKIMPAQPYLKIMKSWIFKYYLCQWCMGAANKRRSKIKNCKKLVVIFDE
jgi:hypothetical protein